MNNEAFTFTYSDQEAMKALIQQCERDLKIVVAEDHAANRRYSVTILKKLGYAPVAVSDGMEIIEWTKSNPCHVILMDLDMPVLDGIHATKTIRAWERDNGLVSRNQIPIYIMAVTAANKNANFNPALEAGVNTFIEKPLMQNDLKDHLQRTGVELALARYNHPLKPMMIREYRSATPLLENLRQELGDNEASELLHDFLSSTPARLSELSIAWITSKFEDLMRMAHSFKSVCQIYGLTHLSDLSLSLEEAAKRDDKKQTDILIEQINLLFRAMDPLLRSHVKSV